MIRNNKTYFSRDDLRVVVETFSSEKKIAVSAEDILSKMCKANIFYNDQSEGDVYKFKYPYIFYYFCGHYIAYNLKNTEVKEAIEYMSSRLHNETFGNIIIFVCHFANNTEVIETILYNAYETLSNYNLFDFSKANPIFSEIKEAVNALISDGIGSNDDVEKNKDRNLENLDNAGINDGHITESEDNISADVSEKEQDLAAISASFKTLDVLGQILQNYPGEINGDLKVAMIDEIHKLGMRSVQAIVNTTGYFEEDMINFLTERATKEGKKYSRDQITQEIRKFINMLITGMIRGMVNKVATSLNSRHLLIAAKETFEKDDTISAKLVFLELKVNCLKQVDFQEISQLKKVFDDSDEDFASRILSSIISHYLRYNKCDYRLRAKLCKLCGFSLKGKLIENQSHLLS